MKIARSVTLTLYVVADKKTTNEEIVDDVYEHVGNCDQFTFCCCLEAAEQEASEQNRY